MDDYDKCEEIVKYFSDRSSRATKSIKSITDKLYRQRTSRYEELYNSIVTLSNKEFADEAVEILTACNNMYGWDGVYKRMEITIALLKKGISQNNIKKLLETQTEWIAINFL